MPERSGFVPLSAVGRPPTITVGEPVEISDSRVGNTEVRVPGGAADPAHCRFCGVEIVSLAHAFEQCLRRSQGDCHDPVDASGDRVPGFEAVPDATKPVVDFGEDDDANS